MNKQRTYKIPTEGGQVIITAVIFFLLISLALMLAVASPVAEQIRAGGNYLKSAQSYSAAEALNEEALYRLNKGLSLPGTLTLALNNSTSTASVTDLGGTKQIVAEGFDGNLSRAVRTTFTLGEGASFNYGLQTGNGGLVMSGGAGIVGNVYSNGDIIGSGGPYITGTAIAANASAAVADQINIGSSTPAYSLTMATSTANEDFAQSFTVSTTSPVTEIWLYMRQVGSTPNPTVRIMNNGSNRPGNTTITSGTLSSSQITSSYGWVAVNPTSNPSLTPGTTYWLVIDTAPYWYNPAAYFVLGGNNNGYAGGSSMRGKVGGTWAANNPSAADGYFQLYLGGDYGVISGMTVGTGGTGNAQAHTVNNSTVAGTIYCQSGTGNNKNCDTSQSDPVGNAYPISQAQIDDWKAEAEDGLQKSTWSLGGSTATSTPGPTKVNGNLSLSGGAILTLNGTLHVTGNLSVTGGAKIVLGSSYGGTAGVIIVDGLTTLDAGGGLNGNGTTGSYAVLISTSACPSGTGCGGNNAIEAGGGTGAVVLVAQSGTIEFTGGASAKSAVAQKMIMGGGTILQYETGVSNMSFSSGPSGAYNIESWNEIAQ